MPCLGRLCLWDQTCGLANSILRPNPCLSWRELLLALIEQPGKVFKRVTLLDQVWGREFDGETRTVDVHIGRLRKVLTQFGAEDVIRTVRGSGYALY